MSERHCPTCTCGLTRVEWSDREAWVDLTDPDSVASAVMHCALDHSYDRTGDGVPYNIPDDLRELLAPVVAKHLSAVEPQWEDKTVYMYDAPEKREAFYRELISVISNSTSTTKAEGKLND